MSRNVPSPALCNPELPDRVGATRRRDVVVGVEQRLLKLAALMIAQF